MVRAWVRGAVVVVAGLLMITGGRVCAGQECGRLAPRVAPPGRPQFTAQQKRRLFDFEQRQSLGAYRAVDDAALTAEIGSVFQRLLAHAPVLDPVPQAHLLVAAGLVNALARPPLGSYTSSVYMPS
ncbi:MAG: hypothetical protein ACRD01_03205 [Terriglobales bacterium]